MNIVGKIQFLMLWIACGIAGVVSHIWMLFAGIANSDRAEEIALAFDYLANKATGGKEDKYISSRCWRNRAQPHYAALVQVINLAFWDRNHCRDSFEAERRGMKC